MSRYIKYPESAYSSYELKRELSNVFQSVWFVDLDEKMLVQNSYFDNFQYLVDYARQKNIDEKEYIASIRDCLLTHGKKLYVKDR